MAVAATTIVQVDLGAGFVTLNDVIGGSLFFSYGINGTGIVDRVASTGTLDFELDNSAANSTSTVGYYSPGHASVLSGWDVGIPIRVKITYGGTSYYKWRGYVDSITVNPGKMRRRVRVQCVDWMDHAARARISGLAVQTNKQSHEILNLIVDEISQQPAAEEIAFGSDEYPFALDNAQDESFSAMTEFQRLAQSELGYVYVKGDTTQGETLTFESRMNRALSTAVAATLGDSDLESMRVSYSREEILNKVLVSMHPRTIDSAATSVLFSLGNQSQLTVGETVSFNAPYRDPNQRAQRVGGVEMVTPVQGTDWEFSTSTAGEADLNAQLTVTATFGGNSAEVTVTNNGPFDGYLTKFQLRGKGLYSYETIVFTAEDATSQTNYGANSIKLDMPYQSNPSIGSDAAAYSLSLNKDALSRVESARFLANRSDTLMTAALAVEVGDRIALDETVTGIDSNYFVHGISMQLGPGVLIRCSWLLAPADVMTYWHLGTTGYTELGTSTRLGYGLFEQKWRLGVSAFGVSTYLNP